MSAEQTGNVDWDNGLGATELAGPAVATIGDVEGVVLGGNASPAPDFWVAKVYRCPRLSDIALRGVETAFEDIEAVAAPSEHPTV
jgi:hypothetical protein